MFYHSLVKLLSMKKLIFLLSACALFFNTKVLAQANQDCVNCINTAYERTQICEYQAWEGYQYAVEHCENIFCYDCRWGRNACCIDYYLDFCEAAADMQFEDKLAECSEAYWDYVDNYCFCDSCPCRQ